MNVLIIGCGYVGSAVANYWQQKMTLVVTATTTTSEKVPALRSLAQKVLLVEGNDVESLKSAVKNQDIVLLCVGSKKGTSYEDTYLGTAKNLVNALEKSSVKQLIYTSTCSVYGEQNGALVNEETPVQPISANGEVIKETEQVLLSAATSQLHVCILRLGGIYGSGRELLKIYSRAAGTTRPGTGLEPANWIHLDDIVAAIDFARQHRLQGIYNLVDEENFKNREVIARVCDTHNLPQVQWDTGAKSNGNYNAQISNQKIKNAGYKFIHPQMIF